MNNTVKQLRQALRMNQVDFGKAIGRSYAAVRNYESGARMSPDAQRRITDLAMQYGLGDLVDDWIAEREGTAGQPIPVISPGTKAASGSDNQWVDLLLRILRSGNRAAIRGVQQNLLAFEQLTRKPEI